VVKRVAAVECEVHGHRGLAKTRRHGHRELGVVLDYQHPHYLSASQRCGLTGTSGPWSLTMTGGWLQKSDLVTGLQPTLTYKRQHDSPN